MEYLITRSLQSGRETESSEACMPVAFQLCENLINLVGRAVIRSIIRSSWFKHYLFPPDHLPL